MLQGREQEGRLRMGGHLMEGGGEIPEDMGWEDNLHRCMGCHGRDCRDMRSGEGDR